jgi:hypothetical protein
MYHCSEPFPKPFVDTLNLPTLLNSYSNISKVVAYRSWLTRNSKLEEAIVQLSNGNFMFIYKSCRGEYSCLSTTLHGLFNSIQELEYTLHYFRKRPLMPLAHHMLQVMTPALLSHKIVEMLSQYCRFRVDIDKAFVKRQKPVCLRLYLHKVQKRGLRGPRCMLVNSVNFTQVKKDMCQVFGLGGKQLIRVEKITKRHDGQELTLFEQLENNLEVVIHLYRPWVQAHRL